LGQNFNLIYPNFEVNNSLNSSVTEVKKSAESAIKMADEFKELFTSKLG
jgi:hypothetical protein